MTNPTSCGNGPWAVWHSDSVWAESELVVSKGKYLLSSKTDRWPLGHFSFCPFQSVMRNPSIKTFWDPLKRESCNFPAQPLSRCQVSPVPPGIKLISCPAESSQKQTQEKIAYPFNKERVDIPGFWAAACVLWRSLTFVCRRVEEEK